MRMKENKGYIDELQPIEIYKLVLDGERLKIFPKGFWQRPDSKDNAIILTKYLIEDYLKLSDEELKKQLSKKLFIDNGLREVLKLLNNNPYEIINLIYPEKFKPWEFDTIKNSFWTKANIIKATKWLVEDKLKLSEEKLKEQLSKKLFIDNGLKGVLQALNGSPYDVINLVYPEKFKPWEFKNKPKNYWKNEENIIEATKWLIEDKLELSYNELHNQLSVQLFVDNGLYGMLQILNNSPYDVINLAYPNSFKPWAFKHKPRNYWDNKDNIIKATKWLIDDKLKLSDDEIREQLSAHLFMSNGLNGMLQVLNGSPYEVINLAYPVKFYPWEFGSVPKNYWSDISNGIKAIKWLIEEKLKLSDDELDTITDEIFIDNNLNGMLCTCFNGSSKKAIKEYLEYYNL